MPGMPTLPPRRLPPLEHLSVREALRALGTAEAAAADLVFSTLLAVRIHAVDKQPGSAYAGANASRSVLPRAEAMSARGRSRRAGAFP